MAIIQRRKSYTATIGNIRVGGDAPVMVQSMTNTDTADIASTVHAGGGTGPRRLARWCGSR